MRHGWFRTSGLGQGLAYDVYSYFEPRLAPGPFEAGLQTKCEHADTAIKSLMSEISRIRTEQVSDSELADAKAYFIGSFPLQLETDGELAQMLLNMEFYGLGSSYIREYPGRIAAVKKEDVLRVAKQYLDPSHFVLAIVTRRQSTSLNLPRVKFVE